jgi:hypothetical protein
MMLMSDRRNVWSEPGERNDRSLEFEERPVGNERKQAGKKDEDMNNEVILATTGAIS